MHIYVVIVIAQFFLYHTEPLALLTLTQEGDVDCSHQCHCLSVGVANLYLYRELFMIFHWLCALSVLQNRGGIKKMLGNV